MIGWPLLPGLMRPMSVVVPGLGSQNNAEMALAIDRHASLRA
jgi:hypothetical protein